MRKTFLLPVAASAGPPPAPTVDNIEYSVRFNSADSAYLSRTPSSAGNRKTWTWSGWVKRSSLGRGNLFNVYDGSNLTPAGYTNMQFSTADALVFGTAFTTYRVTTQVFRDLSAWYHLVIAVDTTSVVPIQRIKIYVNGEEITNFSTTNIPSQNADLAVNGTFNHRLGSEVNQFYFDGYLANIELIDGQALTPSSFGFTDSSGVWQPKAYTGDYNGPDINGATSPYVFPSNDPNPSYNSISSINSNSGNYAASVTGGGSIKVKFATTQNNVTSISFRGGSWAQFALYDVYVNGTKVVNQASTASTWGEVTHNISSTNIDEFEIRGADGYSLAGLKFNGTLVSGTPSRGTSSYNGFHLDFADTSSATALGNDVSGNNNDWTVNNISVTAGSGNDSLVDSPTNYGTDTGAGGEVRGNYATLNPLFADTYGSAVNGNLEYLNTGGVGGAIASTMAVSSGKWYYETSPTNNASGSGNPVYPCGFLDLDIFTEFTDDIWYTAGTGFYGYYVRDGRKIVNGTISTFATSSTVNDVIGFALDLNAGELEVYKNGTSLGVAATGLTGRYIPCVTSSVTGQTATVNFGQQPFKYPLAGYKAWCSTNLPTPAVADGSTAMDVALYTGNNSTQTISGLGFSPDLVWIKSRSTGDGHQLYDVERSATFYLASNSTAAEGVLSNGLTSFNTDGFTVGNNSGINNTGQSVVSWTWDAGSSTVSNTDGSITSSVRVNTSAGFSISTFTTPVGSTINFTVGHGLGVKPGMMIFKNRGTGGWYVWHKDFSNPTLGYLQLESTAPIVNNSSAWNNTAPTSSVATLGGGFWSFGYNVIGYCWAPVEGFSAFGSYTGNGSTDGPFVYTGMRPKWIMVKNTSSNGSWVIYDTERDVDNLSTQRLAANSNVQENDGSIVSNSTTLGFDVLSNGFKLKITGANHNNSGNTYIYAAFAEHPFKTSRAR